MGQARHRDQAAVATSDAASGDPWDQSADPRQHLPLLWIVIGGRSVSGPGLHRWMALREPPIVGPAPVVGAHGCVEIEAGPSATVHRALP